MQLQRFHTVQDFWQETEAFLRQHEAENSWLIGNLETLRHHRDRYPRELYLAAVEENGTALAAAIKVPPHKLLLSKAHNSEALAIIAQDLRLESLPGVAGLAAEANIFVEKWRTQTGQPSRRLVDLRLYDKILVLPVAKSVGKVVGTLRLATEADRPLLGQWIPAFFREVAEIDHDPIEQILESGLKHQDFYLWEDRVPVSLAAGKRFDRMARIGLVYTPSEYRQKGYATACVAALSQRFFDQGYRRCYLFTDLSHSTSNSIYLKMGYRPVSDWHEYRFSLEEEIDPAL